MIDKHEERARKWLDAWHDSGGGPSPREALTAAFREVEAEAFEKAAAGAVLAADTERDGYMRRMAPEALMLYARALENEALRIRSRAEEVRNGKL